MRSLATVATLLLLVRVAAADDRDPDAARHYDELGRAEYAKGDYDAAADSFERRTRTTLHRPTCSTSVRRTVWPISVHGPPSSIASSSSSRPMHRIATRSGSTSVTWTPARPGSPSRSSSDRPSLAARGESAGAAPLDTNDGGVRITSGNPRAVGSRQISPPQSASGDRE